MSNWTVSKGCLREISMGLGVGVIDSLLQPTFPIMQEGWGANGF